MSNTTCNSAGLCECEPGFVVRDGTCVSAYLSGCNSDLDCAAIAGMDCGYWAYYDGMWFSNWGNTEYNGICVCKPGYAVNDLACKKVLGSNCDNLKACGNSSHWSYSYHYFSWWGASYVKNYYKHYHSAFYCDVTNVCECSPGYERNADGTDCERVWGSICFKDDDCCGPTFKCNITSDTNRTGTCICADMYARINGTQNGYNYYVYYDYYGREEITCKPLVGLSCSDSCPGNDTHCDGNNMCICNRGYEKNGVCTNYLGSECKSDTPCQHVTNARCDSSTHVCACAKGFFDNGQDKCLPLWGRDCTTDANCGSGDYFCNLVTNRCSCAEGHSELNGRCIMNTTCNAEVPNLPDILRRSPNYILSEREVVIRDDTLKEGWYNIGHFMLSSQSGIPVGGCGTIWPIYLTSVISSLADGSEVTRYVRLVNRSKILDEFRVTIRKCGADHHVFLPKVPVAFVGFCLDTGEPSNPGGNATGRWAQLSQDLNFNTSVPKINFICGVLDEEHSNVPCRTCTGDVYYLNDGFYYTINWYVNDHLCVSLGPFQRPYLRKSYLTESILRERCHQTVIGFKVQCSYEWSLTMLGRRSTPVSSNSIDTGVPAQFIIVPTEGSQQAIIPSTPIGCIDDNTSSVSSVACVIEFPLKRSHSDTCPPTINPNEHYLCGARIVGVTSYGLDQYGSWEYVYSRARYGSLYDQYTGTSMGTHHKRIVSRESHHLHDRYTEEYCPSSAGQSTLWEAYTLPTQKIIVSDTNTTNSTCSIRWSKHDKQPMLIKTKGKQSWSIPIDVTGEFMLFKSLAYPVEVQFKTEKCESSLTVCVCALTFRDGNKIYTVGVCNGITTQGFVWVALDEEHFLRYTETGSIRVWNGIAMSVTKDYNLHSLTVEITDNGSMEDFTFLDGLCAFEDNTFRASTGGLMLSSDGFLESWSIGRQTISSLLAPQLIHTRYSYQDNMYSCSCPLDSEDISGSNSSFTTASSMTYASVSRCSKNDAYNVTRDGETWVGTVVPDFAIENVTLAFHFVETPNGMNAYERISVCLFDGFDGFLYDIYWYADTTLIHKKAKQSLRTAEFNQISFDTLMTAYNSRSKDVCAVNKLWRCAVSVLNTNGVEVLGASYSEPFEFITFQDKFMSMARGGVVDFHFTMNLPVVCLDGKPCNIEVKVIDENDDYQCQDSTLAVINERTCGDFINGIELFRNIDTFQKERNMTLTTKNNNKYSLRDAFAMTVFIGSKGVVEPFWNDCYFTGKINVFVRDIETFWKGVFCYATNDPRLMTFDGQYYSMQLSGEFTLYKHQRYPIEVQIQTEPCWPGGWTTCTCGVTVRAGRDVYTVTHCEGMHLIEWIDLADDVLEVYIEPGYMHKFYLPQGTIVEARYFNSPWWSTMNVYVYPSPNDMNRVGGLCGTFNGNWQDDFLHSDGFTSPSPAMDWGFWVWWVWGGNPDNFSQSWSVSHEHSLMNPDYVSTLEPWNTNDNLCVCPLIVNKRENWCSRNEDKTCVDFIYKKRGKRIQKLLRDERSLDTFNYREEMDIRDRLLKLLSLKKERSAFRVKRDVNAPNPEELVAAYNESQASCAAYLKEMCGSDLSEEVSARNKNQSSSCAEDKMFNLTATGPEESTCRNVQSSTIMIVDKDIEFQTKNPEKAQLVIASCPDNCNSHGNCFNGTCICDEHYDPESNCKLDLRDPPTIIEVTGDGNCNPRHKACHFIRFTTQNGCSNTTVCLITFTQYKVDGSSTESVIQTVSANCPNNFDAYCPTTVQSRKKRQTVNENPVIAERYNVSLSNDNSSFSSPKMVTVLDTTCVTIENGSAVILDEYCLIDNICYGNHTELDDCHSCNPAVKRFSWSLKDDYCDIGGVCYPSGNVSTISCISECNPTVEKYAWSLKNDVCSIEGQCFNAGDSNASPKNCLYCDLLKDQFSWSQKTGFCYIAGVCYVDAAMNPTDSCRHCNVSVDTGTWQLNMNDSGCEVAEEKKDDNIMVIAIGAALGTGAVVAIAIAIGLYIYKAMQASKLVAARTTGTLFESAKNQHFKFRVEPMRRDPVERLTTSDNDMPTTSVDPNRASVPEKLYN
ncbi:hypothetical protein DPMN_191931 [Dreissena polymorpha]|uniref:VWFD domain-containing protein n=2 Tax=Dreissena polymorpha TaxID=45954 RepID=A0A9D3Y0X2_DREPO|nr:hypothetical protein DPMN_191931 [Dreissena polymorpha]